MADITAEVAALRQRGVTFEDYPEYAMPDGIADIGGEPGQGPADRAAWFHDIEDNLISLYQFQTQPRATTPRPRTAKPRAEHRPPRHDVR